MRHLNADDIECIQCHKEKYTRYNRHDYDLSKWDLAFCQNCGHEIREFINSGDDAIDGFQFIVENLDVYPCDVNGLNAISAAIKFKEWHDKYSSKYLYLNMSYDFDSDMKVYIGLRVETIVEKTARLIEEEIERLSAEKIVQENKKKRYMRFLELKAKYGN